MKQVKQLLFRGLLKQNFSDIGRDVQVHFFRELDHSQSLPKKSEPRSLTFVNFYLVKI